ncbi:hypothetical protein EDD85DRAFT_794127 [Armillaria nabsnona]|nr:hypothetical protein EDD85DRAFT_794127 [Armillaria nabsnona]
MHAFIAFQDHSTSLLSHNKSWRYIQEIRTNDHASKRIYQGTSARKLNLRKCRQTQLNARTQGSNAEFSWPGVDGIPQNGAVQRVEQEKKRTTAMRRTQYRWIPQSQLAVLHSSRNDAEFILVEMIGGSNVELAFVAEGLVEGVSDHPCRYDRKRGRQRPTKRRSPVDFLQCHVGGESLPFKPYGTAVVSTGWTNIMISSLDVRIRLASAASFQCDGH